MKYLFSLVTALFLTITSFGQKATQEYAEQLADKGNFKQALEVINEVIATNSPRASYYHYKTSYLLNLENYGEAIKTLVTAIKIMPDSSSLYDTRGTLLEAAGLYNEAVQDYTIGYEKAQKNTSKSHLLTNRGGTKAKLRNFEGAYSDLIQALKLDSANIDALNNLATVCDEVNRPNETMGYLQKIISINPKYVPAYVNIGFKYQKEEQHEKAIEYFNKAIALDPDEPFSFSNRSFSKLKIKDLDGAMKDIDYSISLRSSNSWAYKVRALINIEMKEGKKACEDLMKAIELGYSDQYGSEVQDLIYKNCK
jgi:tetratricopeptide (TPR) repeat protein